MRRQEVVGMRWRRVVFAAVLSVVMAAPALAQGELSVSVAKKGTLVDGGRAARITVTTVCPEGEEPLEAFVYLVQDGIQSSFAGIPVTCDGQPHTGTVQVFTFDEERFHKGKAQASAYLLLRSGEDTSPVYFPKLK